MKQPNPKRVDSEWAIKFKGRDAFGEFCLALKDDGYLFTLAGHQTVVLSSHPDLLLKSPKSFHLLKQFREAGMILEEYPVPSKGKRYLPTEGEARELLRKFTEARRARRAGQKQ